MKSRNIIKSAVLATAIAAALSSPVYSYADELFTAPPTAAHQAAPTQAQLAGKNFVQEFDKNGAVKRTIITGNAGDGTDALTVSDAASVVNVAGDQASVNVPLPNSVQGQAAIDFLGGNFNKTAADNNVTPEKLKEILNDPTMHLDTATGKIFVIDSDINEHTLPPQEGTALAPVVTPTTMLKAPPLTDVFKLHSNLGASKVIYIDFNGQLVQNSAWSATDINAPAYDLSGNPLVFDDNERANIYSIWARVAEDYLPFDVDITTEEPAAAALAKTSSTDINYGTRVVVTKSGTISCNCGGVAYVGIVNYVNAQKYQPAWVFQQSLANNEKYIAEAISHEAGHTLGLYHDGDNATGYYLGHGTGATSWAPIMGAGYYKNVTQWSAGAYPNANNKQDDFAVFAANGFPARKDDYGNAVATSATLPMTASGATNNAHAFGIIETNTDKDVFVFNTAGQIDIAIAPANKGANLDIVATLSDSTGNIVLTSNPVDLLTANIAATVAPGTYYLSIAGTGRAAITSDPGYPAYASLGQYEITGTVSGGIVAAAPVAAISVVNTTGIAPFTVNFSSGGSIGNGAITGFAWNFEAGATSAAANPAYTFTKAGTFPVSLTVTNEFGLTGTTAVTINVQPAPDKTVFSVKAINLAVSQKPVRGIASVTVYDANGVAVPKATVNGTWTGYFTGSGSGVANSAGIATIASNKLPSNAPKTGTATFAVTSIVLNGYVYDATKNTLTIKTVTR